MRRRCSAHPWVLILIFYFSLPIQGNAQSSNIEQTITIGTGGLSDLSHKAGIAMCNLWNTKSRIAKIKCRVDNSAGAVININRLRRGNLTFALVPADIQYYGIKGYGPFSEEKEYPELRSVFSLHTELLTVISRKDSGIRTFNDLRGRKVNIGNLGSAQRTIMDLLMRLNNWKKDDFKKLLVLPPQKAYSALCRGELDVSIITAAHPNSFVRKNIYNCEATLINVEGRTIKKAVNKYPFFSSEKIPAYIYDGLNMVRDTFGVNVSLVTTSDIPKDIVYEMIRTFFSEINKMKRYHPAFKNLTYQGMSQKGFFVPLHTGAKLYYSTNK